jgi:hypothetical protein
VKLARPVLIWSSYISPMFRSSLLTRLLAITNHKLHARICLNQDDWVLLLPTVQKEPHMPHNLHAAIKQRTTIRAILRSCMSYSRRPAFLDQECRVRLVERNSHTKYHPSRPTSSQLFDGLVIPLHTSSADSSSLQFAFPATPTDLLAQNIPAFREVFSCS